VHFILLPILAFVIILFIHVIFWNIFRIKSEILALMTLFFACPFFFWVIIFIYSEITNTYEGIDILLSAFLFFVLCGAYVQTYPAISTEIPSSRILTIIKNANKEGIKKEDIFLNFSENELLSSRIELLLQDKLIVVNNNESIELSQLGSFLANSAIFYRRILGLREGRG
jgi:hypothetical protein